jgi:hypothetical protein
MPQSTGVCSRASLTLRIGSKRFIADKNKNDVSAIFAGALQTRMFQVLRSSTKHQLHLERSTQSKQ